MIKQILTLLFCLLSTDVYALLAAANKTINGTFEIQRGGTMELSQNSTVRVNGVIMNHGTITFQGSATVAGFNFHPSKGKIRNFLTFEPKTPTTYVSFSSFRGPTLPFLHEGITISDLTKVSLEPEALLDDYSSVPGDKSGLLYDLSIILSASGQNRLENSADFSGAREATFDSTSPLTVEANLGCILPATGAIPMNVRITGGDVATFSGTNTLYVDGIIYVGAGSTAKIGVPSALFQSDITAIEEGIIDFTPTSGSASYTTAPNKTIDASGGAIHISDTATVTVPSGGTIVF